MRALRLFTDASWADVIPQRKSTLCYLIFCNNAVFSWKSTLSSVLAMSSAEAELIALCACAADIAYYLIQDSIFDFRLSPQSEGGCETGLTFVSRCRCNSISIARFTILSRQLPPRQPGLRAQPAQGWPGLACCKAVSSEDAGFLSHVHTDRPLGRPRGPLLQQHVGLLVAAPPRLCADLVCPKKSRQLLPQSLTI